MPERPELSEAELEILRMLWAMGPSTVRAVREEAARQGRRWAYTTVQTLLHRLREKGYATAGASAGGAAHVFRASASREEVLRDRLDDLADRLCDGAPAPLVLALVQGGRLSAEELARLRSLIDELAAGEGTGSGC